MSDAKRRTSLYPVAYLGVDPLAPLEFTIDDRDPTQDDYNNWNIGTLWLNESTNVIFMLVNKVANVATWILPSAAAGVVAGDNINITGGPTVNLNETIHWPNTNMTGTSGVFFNGSVGGVGGTRHLHNYGSATINEQNVFLGQNSGNLTLNTVSAVRNIGLGHSTNRELTTGSDNIAIGSAVFVTTTTGSFNIGIGHTAVSLLTTGTNNTCIGAGTSRSLTTGSFNTMCGRDQFRKCKTGSYNVGIGYSNAARIGSGTYDTSESSNLDLAFRGQIGMSNELHIGSDQAQPAFHDRCFIAGIHGVTSAGSSAVLINSTKLTGTVLSSERYKENISDIGDDSSKILNLRPVTFNYKEDKSNHREWGLIAEEVYEIFPDMVVLDKDDMPFTVQYNKLVPLITNELQRMLQRIKQLEVLLTA